MRGHDTSGDLPGRIAAPDDPGSASVAPGASRPEEAHAWVPAQLKPPAKGVGGDCGAAAGGDDVSGGPDKPHHVREYTLGEEIANSITHGIGLLLSIAALPILVVAAMRDGGGAYLAAALIFTITMILEYAMSTLYHAISADRAKRVFKVLDHSCIYLLIAGSYAPFCLITLADSGGAYLLAFVWIVAVLGIVFEAAWVFRPRWLSAVIYLLLGWAVVWYLPTLVSLLPFEGLSMLVAGGVCYSIGTVFYVLKKIPYMHSIFHLWVLAGSVLLYLAVLFCVF